MTRRLAIDALLGAIADRHGVPTKPRRECGLAMTLAYSEGVVEGHARPTVARRPAPPSSARSCPSSADLATDRPPGLAQDLGAAPERGPRLRTRRGVSGPPDRPAVPARRLAAHSRGGCARADDRTHTVW